MRKSYEDRWQCSRPRVMGADREGSGQALTGVRVGQVLNLEKVRINPVPTRSGCVEGKTSLTRDVTGSEETGGVVDPVHARKAPHAEIGRSLNRPGHGDPVRAENLKGAMRS